VLFTRTKHGAKKLAKVLTTAGVPAVELHGNLSQSARERNLEAFREGSTRVLVATDIAARGIHVDEVALVVHVDPPAEHKAYLHRSGRTARAGSEGVVVTIVTPDQKSDARALARAAGIAPTITQVAPGHEVLRALVPDEAPFVKPTAQTVAAQPQRSAQPAGRPSGRPGPRPASGQASRSGTPSGQPGRPGSGGQARRSRSAGQSRQGQSRHGASRHNSSGR
jgi:superfamily II DNA/RNA helicase